MGIRENQHPECLMRLKLSCDSNDYRSNTNNNPEMSVLAIRNLMWVDSIYYSLNKTIINGGWIWNSKSLLRRQSARLTDKSLLS